MNIRDGREKKPQLRPAPRGRHHREAVAPLVPFILREETSDRVDGDACYNASFHIKGIPATTYSHTTSQTFAISNEGYTAVSSQSHLETIAHNITHTDALLAGQKQSSTMPADTPQQSL